MREDCKARWTIVYNVWLLLEIRSGEYFKEHVETECRMGEIVQPVIIDESVFTMDTCDVGPKNAKLWDCVYYE